MNEKILPATGYRLLSLFAYEQTCQMVEPDEIDQTLTDRTFSFYWNWYPSGHREFSVWLGIFLHPSSDAPEKVRVAYIADFAIDGEPEVPLPVFVLREAPSLIYPYLREAVSSLTGRGISGPYVLSTIDVREALAEEFRFTDSMGTAMLRDVEEAEAFGFAVKLPPKRTKRKPREKPAAAKRK